MARRKLLTLAECEREYPEIFQDATGKKDTRLKDGHKRAMVHMINQGESPQDAKIKALCVALPPDHFEVLTGGGPFPKMLYHEAGGTKTVADEEELAEVMKQKGWSLKPSQKHIDKLQRGSTSRDESIKRLQRELDAELKKKQEEQEAATAAA